MYLDLFRLKALPFRLSPDAGFLYACEGHAAARTAMQASVENPDGVLVITGDTGAGKTTVIESFLAGLDASVVVARLNQTQVTATGFLQGLLVQFGDSPFSMTPDEMRQAIAAFVAAQQAAGRRVLLIIDEAQNLAPDVFEEVRQLATLEGPKGPCIAVVLVGQLLLADLLETPALIPLAALVHHHLKLGALPPEALPAYIQHRLDVVGAAGRVLFDDGALELIRIYSGGVPRLVNSLCDTTLMQAYESHTCPAGAREVRAAVESLQWVEYASRPRATKRIAPAYAEPPPSLVPAAPVAPRREPPLGYLQVHHESRVIAALELRPGRVIIGRTSENDLQIDSRYVSRHHCQVTSTPEGVVIEDLNSTNGIHVEGERVRRHVLGDGDVVSIGQHSLTFQAIPKADDSP